MASIETDTVLLRNCLASKLYIAADFGNLRTLFSASDNMAQARPYSVNSHVVRGVYRNSICFTTRFARGDSKASHNALSVCVLRLSQHQRNLFALCIATLHRLTACCVHPVWYAAFTLESAIRESAQGTSNMDVCLPQRHPDGARPCSPSRNVRRSSKVPVMAPAGFEEMAPVTSGRSSQLCKRAGGLGFCWRSGG